MLHDNMGGFMTQKELAYMEDAIGHIGNIQKILNVTIDNLENDDLISFMNDEVQKQTTLHQQLIEFLKEKANG